MLAVIVLLIADVIRSRIILSSQTRVDTVVARVGKIIRLPTGETPVVAVVSDPSKLTNQPFFAKAKAGDQVLMYPVAKEAFLYDPVANRILEVAPIDTGTSTSKTQ